MSFEFAVGIGKDTNSESAINQALAMIDKEKQWDLVLAWWTSTLNDPEAIGPVLQNGLNAKHIAGCTVESLVAGDQEIEMEPAVCIWCAKLPNVEISAAHIEFENTSEGGTLSGWPEALEGAWPDNSFMISIADPFSFPMDWMVERFNIDRPGIPILGGMASGGMQPGENLLILDQNVTKTGAVVLRFSGPIKLKHMVSQGCRPIGEPFVVTLAERNELHGLGGKPAYDQLQNMFTQLSTREQRAVNQGLFVGRVINEYKDNRAQGDFLVRNVVGIEPESRAIVVADYIKVGQTIQFHIRDNETADAEMQQLLKQMNVANPRQSGALLFTCNGRGTRLFDQANHDATAITSAFNEIALAGFFAAGEIGPIGNQNFMHGFTASLAILEPE